MSEQKPAEQYKEFVPFNPSNDSGFEPKIILRDDREITIHETNNLPILFGAFMRHKASMDPSNPVESLYFEMIKNNGLNLRDLIEGFIVSQPELFDKLEAIYKLQEEEAQLRKLVRERFHQGAIPILATSKNGLPDETEVTRRQYYYSQMFDSLAVLAKSDNPAYDLTVICR